MKTIKPILILCAVLCFATACKKEVDMTLQQKTVLENTDIRSIVVNNAWQVSIVADSVTFVELSYSAYLEPYLKTKMTGSQLEIGFTGNVRPASNSVFSATIHTSKVEKIDAKDASKLNFFGHYPATSDSLIVHLEDASVCSGLDYSGHECKVIIEDASQFIGFQLSCTNGEVRVSDASTCKGNFDMQIHLIANLSDASHLITFGGTAPYAMIKLQDASLLNMVQTEVNEMHVDLSGASEATVNVKDHMEGTLNESSTLYYKGHPQLNVDCSDGSQLIPF